jgi:hypothetical protein
MIKSTAIELIVFLSKILIFVEKRYWSIELKIVAVIWVVKKLHHMIKTSKHSTIIWTDHSATTVIVKQTKLITFNTDKLNLRLIKIVMYLSQFDLDVRHKSERDHVISDALSRLSSFDSSIDKITNILKNVDAYVEIMIKMSSSFKNRFIEEYKTDKQWSFLYEMLNNSQKNSMNEQTAHNEIEFERKNDLIYYLNRTTSRTRLCISKSLMQDIFKMTHDDQTHVEFHRAHVSITKTLYIRRLTHYLRQYIEYCSQCLLHQTKRHKSYDALNSISSSKILFHITTINFVLALSQSKQKKFDIMLIISNKFFKDKLLIADVNIWKSKNWTVELLRYLQLCNWDVLRIIISNRDAKFRFELWRWVFKTLKIDLFISTAYHSQSDDLSEWWFWNNQKEEEHFSEDVNSMY